MPSPRAESVQLNLTLRRRLIAGLLVVAVILSVGAVLMVATTERHLVDQLDKRLEASFEADFEIVRAGVEPSAPDFTPLDRAFANRRLSSFYEAVVSEDGVVTVVFAPDLANGALALPDLTATQASEQIGDVFTLSAIDGSIRYRAMSMQRFTDDGVIVRALSLGDVDETMGRLTLLVVLGTLGIVSALLAVAWWVIRLGIQPIEDTTRTAAAIGTHDLAARVPEQRAGTEAAALAEAINRMLGQIETAVEDQQESEDRLRRFISDASHELRTPVTTILGYAELHRHGGLRDEQELADAMRRTEEEARRMRRLVEDMLTLARLDRERPHQPGAVDLSQLLTDVASDAQVTAPGHAIRATIAPHLVLEGDEDRLRQVFTNVVGNAVAHTPAGTRVAIDTTEQPDTITILVADDGPGIAPAHIERVTERFYRTDPSRARARGGTGLGLAIADAVVAVHGGTLSLESSLGEGTTVRVALPRAGR